MQYYMYVLIVYPQVKYYKFKMEALYFRLDKNYATSYS